MHVGTAADDEFCFGYWAIVLDPKYTATLGYARGHTPLDAIERALQIASNTNAWSIPVLRKRAIGTAAFL